MEQSCPDFGTLNTSRSFINNMSFYVVLVGNFGFFIRNKIGEEVSLPFAMLFASQKLQVFSSQKVSPIHRVLEYLLSLAYRMPGAENWYSEYQ